MTAVSKLKLLNKYNLSSSENSFGQPFVEQTKGQSFRSIMESALSSLDSNWKSSEKHIQSVIKSVPENYKSMLEAQIIVSNFSLQVELVTKVADGVQSTIKKLQQQNT